MTIPLLDIKRDHLGFPPYEAPDKFLAAISSWLGERPDQLNSKKETPRIA